MKRIGCFLSLALYSLQFIAAQSPAVSKKDRLRFGVELNYGMSRLVYSPLGHFNGLRGGIPNPYSPGQALGLMGLISYSLKPKVSIETGIQIYSSGSKFDSEVLTFSGTPSPTTPIRVKYRYQNQFIEMPFRVNYTLPLEKLNLCFSSGWFNSLPLIMTTRIQNLYMDGSSRKYTAFGRPWRGLLFFDPFVATGIVLPLKQHLKLRIQLLFRSTLLHTRFKVANFIEGKQQIGLTCGLLF